MSPTELTVWTGQYPDYYKYELGKGGVIQIQLWYDVYPTALISYESGLKRMHNLFLARHWEYK